MATGQHTVVKSGTHRVVYRVDLPHGTVFVKHYRCGGWRDRLRQLFRATASERESRRAAELARRGVASIVPMAVGEVHRAGMVSDNFLITQGIADSCTVAELLRRDGAATPLDQDAARRRLIVSVAKFCAQLHQRGVEHNDLHLDNLLVRLDDRGQPLCGDDGAAILYLIDVPGVRFSRPLQWRRSRRNLAQLGAAALTLTSPTERKRFWFAYLRTRPELVLSDRGVASRQLADRIGIANRDRQRSRDRRAWGDNRDYHHLSNAAGRAFAVADVSPTVLRALVDSAASLVAQFQRQPIKLGHRGAVFRGELELGSTTFDVALKRSREPFWRAWIRPRRASRAAVQWQRAAALLARDLATARPLACLEPRTRTWTAESYLLTEWLPGASDLHQRGWELAGLPAGPRRRAADSVAQAVGDLLGRMHRWRITHRDLKWCNLLVTPAPQPTALLIDLDGLRLPGRWSLRRPLSHKTRVRNLSRLAVGLQLHPWVSCTVCLRFLRAYLQAQPELPGTEWKTLWRGVQAHAHRYATRARRRQRPLG